MAIGSWEDFTSKWGFSEGASTESRDYEARALIVAELNEMTGVRAAKIRAIEYDRPGFHNSCLILILPNPEGRSDADLVAAWKADKLEAVELPLSVSEVINEIVVEAYAQDIHDLSGYPTRDNFEKREEASPVSPIREFYDEHLREHRLTSGLQAEPGPGIRDQ